MRAHLVLPMTALLLACGGDDDGEGGVDGGGTSGDASSPAGDATPGGDLDAGAGGDAAPAGSASIGGTVSGQTIEPERAWYTAFPFGDDFVLVMQEGGVTCSLGAPLEGLTATIGFSCGPAEAITYPINGEVTAGCEPGAPHVTILVEGEDGTTFLAEAGSVTVSSADDTSVAGSFTASFGADGALTGSFDAVVCSE